MNDNELIALGAIAVVVVLAIVIVLYYIMMQYRPVIIFIPSNTPEAKFTLPVFGIDSLPGASDSRYYYYVGNNYKNTGNPGNLVSCGEDYWGQTCENIVYPLSYIHDNIGSIDVSLLSETEVNSPSECFNLCDNNCDAVQVSGNICKTYTNPSISNNPNDSYNPFDSGIYIKKSSTLYSHYAYAYKKSTTRYWLNRDDVIRVEPCKEYTLPNEYEIVTNNTKRSLIASNKYGHSIEIIDETRTLPPTYNIVYLR